MLNLCFDKLGPLYEEPMMLLREELREPPTYYSLLQSIANGNSSPKAIAEHAGIPATVTGKYLKTLESLGLIRRDVPFGDNPAKSRKGMYRIVDPFFAYWYRFVGPNSGAIESNVGKQAALKLAFGESFDTYVGQQFETICLQWLIRTNVEGSLPFLATNFGKWWGTNPRKHEQTDIDVVAGDQQSKTLLLGECKWRNRLDETAAMRSLTEREGLIGGYKHTHFVLFTKVPVSDATRRKFNSNSLSDTSNIRFISTEDLYE